MTVPDVLLFPKEQDWDRGTGPVANALWCECGHSKGAHRQGPGGNDVCAFSKIEGGCGCEGYERG